MVSAFPSPAVRWSSRLASLGWLGVSALLHGVWSRLPQPLPQSRQVAEPPALVVVASTSWKDWTPVLFSLPTSRGFSSLLDGSSTDIIPPLASPLQLTSRYELEDVPATASQRLSSDWLQDLPVLQPVTSLIPAWEPEPKRTVSGWRMTALDAPEVGLWFYRDARLENPQRAIRLEGEIEFDAFGQVSFLALDPGETAREWIMQILPDIRKVRIPMDQGGLSTRFCLEFVPAGRRP